MALALNHNLRLCPEHYKNKHSTWLHHRPETLTPLNGFLDRTDPNHPSHPRTSLQHSLTGSPLFSTATRPSSDSYPFPWALTTSTGLLLPPVMLDPAARSPSGGALPRVASPSESAFSESALFYTCLLFCSSTTTRYNHLQAILDRA